MHVLLRSTEKWPIWVWNIFSIFSIDKSWNKWQVTYSILLMISSIFNLHFTSVSTCIMERACDNSFSTFAKGLFLRVVAFNCLISRMVIFFKSRNHLIQYTKTLEKYHVLAPMTDSETEIIKNMSYGLVGSIILLTVPVNIYRMTDIVAFKSTLTTVSHIFLYVQNFSTNCVESHFSILCFILHQKLVGINRDLMAMKIDTDVRTKYPFAMHAEQYEKNIYAIDYSTEVLHSLADGRPMIDFLESLKLKYKLIREAVNNLNDLFGVQLGLSMCSICIYGFDLYFFIMNVNVKDYQIQIYVWILQYTVRFVTVVILGNSVTQQVISNKLLPWS